jgi:hypothetical protein
VPAHLTRKAGYTKDTAQTGAVTLIQCFGGSLNLNIHFHMLFLEGIYADNKHGTSRFRHVKAPTGGELTQLTQTIAHRVGRYLERQSLLVRDDENSYLTAEDVDTDNESPLNHLLGSSITYRIAMGPQQGRKVFTLQTLPDCSDDPLAHKAGNVAGFSLHAGITARAHEQATKSRRPQASWNACAVTSQDRRCPPNAYH